MARHSNSSFQTQEKKNNNDIMGNIKYNEYLKNVFFVFFYRKAFHSQVLGFVYV